MNNTKNNLQTFVLEVEMSCHNEIYRNLSFEENGKYKKKKNKVVYRPWAHFVLTGEKTQTQKLGI